MSDIRSIDLRRVDASILMVFLGCMRHRKATEVAREMGLTQPAVSHALGRLRKLYDDPLFVRRAHGLEPTALARDLEPKIRQIVALLAETLAAQQAFDPAISDATIRIGAYDFELTTVLPDLIGRLRGVGPQIGIHTYAVANQEALDALNDARIDIAIGYFDFPKDVETGFVVEELFTERYVVTARAGHPVVAAPPTLDAFAASEHLQVSTSGPVRTLVDHGLRLQGVERQVPVTVPSLFAALSIVGQSDLVMALPSRVAVAHAGRFDLSYQPLPVDGGNFSLHAVRHMRDKRSGLLVWLVDQLRAVARGPGVSPRS